MIVLIIVLAVTSSITVPDPVLPHGLRGTAADHRGAVPAHADATVAGRGAGRARVGGRTPRTEAGHPHGGRGGRHLRHLLGAYPGTPGTLPVGLPSQSPSHWQSR